MMNEGIENKVDLEHKIDELEKRIEKLEQGKRLFMRDEKFNPYDLSQVKTLSDR